MEKQTQSTLAFVVPSQTSDFCGFNPPFWYYCGLWPPWYRRIWCQSVLMSSSKKAPARAFWCIMKSASQKYPSQSTIAPRCGVLFVRFVVYRFDSDPPVHSVHPPMHWAHWVDWDRGGVLRALIATSALGALKPHCAVILMWDWWIYGSIALVLKLRVLIFAHKNRVWSMF